MVDDFTYDFLLQVCQEEEGKQIKAKERKIHYQHCEKCNVEKMMYLHLGFMYALAVVYAAMIYVLYDTMNQQSCTKRGNVFIKEMNIFNQKLESSYVENLLRYLIV